jgi:hypothetical protein
MIPTAKRAEEAARQDLASAGAGDFQPGSDYVAIVRRLNLVGSGLGVLVLLTILFMAIKP